MRLGSSDSSQKRSHSQVWLCVVPTLTTINVALAGQLASMSTVLRTFVLPTVAVPIVIYGLMPHLHRARAHLLMR